MVDFLSSTAATIGFLSLVFLPGAWITFGLSLSPWSFWTKLYIGAILSPVAVCVEFYAIRILGASFEISVFLLFALNFPALILIWRRRGSVPLPDFRTTILWGLVLLVPIACLSWIWIMLPQWRLFFGHPWMYADGVYMFANGELIPEDTLLAGVKLSYPWVLHIYQAVLSYVLDSPPISNFIWTNLIWLILIVQLNISLVTKLGGNRFAGISSVIFLLFGVNFLGFTLHQILPSWIINMADVWGDFRYTPWLMKFFSFTQMPMALGFFSAITFIMAERLPEEDSLWERSLLLFLLLFGLGLIYTILLPSAYALVFAGGFSLVVENLRNRRVLFDKRLIAMGIVLLLTSIIVVLYLSLVTQDSEKATMLGFSSFRNIVKKSLRASIVSFPLLCCLSIVFSKCWKERRYTTSVLVMGSITIFVLFVGFHIPYYSNEYKFIFTAAICLAPFCGLALESLQVRLRQWYLPFTFFLCLLLATPLFQKMSRIRDDYLGYRKYYPLLNTSGFDVKLDESERLYDLTYTIREKTPLDTILVVDQTQLHLPTLTLHLPTLTRRKYFICPNDGELVHIGINLKCETYLKKIRAYDERLIQERKFILDNFFNQHNTIDRKVSLGRILELGRPVGIVLDKRRNKIVLDWLNQTKIGYRLYQGDKFELWLVLPSVRSRY